MRAERLPTVIRVGAFLCALLCLLWSTPLRAADEARVLRARGAQLAQRGDCARAIEITRRARELAPEDAESALLEGVCLLREQRYPEAIAALEEAARLNPESGETALALGRAYYHGDDLAAAEAALARAESLLPDSAEVSLYTGLVLLSQQRSQEAASRLQRAASLDSGEVGSLSNYYAGLAHADAGDRERAVEALRRARELAPDTPWSERAEAALAGSDTPLRRWLVLRGGLDYDSNVALRGDRVALPNNISEDHDGRGWWGADAGAELFRRGGFGGGIEARYTGSAYFQENAFNEHFGVVSAWLDRSLGSHTALRLRPEFGGGIVDDDEYLRFYGLGGDLLHHWGRAGYGTLYGRYQYNDYRFRIPPPMRGARDRDGHGLRAGYDHALALGEHTSIRGGPFVRHYVAQGTEYDHTGFGGWLGIARQLPLRFTLDLNASLARDEYDDRSTFRLPGEMAGKREDLVVIAQAVVRRPIGERASLGARWLYRGNDSNTRAFDYDRHIVGVFAEIAFGN